jgi:hypothetical protein
MKVAWDLLLLRLLLWIVSWEVLLALDRTSTDPFSTSSASSSERYLVLNIERLGLANRLRALADWYHLADISGRKLLLSWIPSIECNISFLELFQDGPPNFSVVTPPLPGGKEGAVLTMMMATEYNLSFATILAYEDPSQSEIDFFFDDPERFLLFDERIQVLYSNYDGPIVLPGTACQTHLAMRSAFYSSLVPVPEVQQAVKEVTKYFRNRFGHNRLSVSSPADS